MNAQPESLILDQDVPAILWEQGGLTIHLGGIDATRQLLARCPIKPGQRVLDLGCGTGHTATTMAHQHQCEIIGLDITRRCLSAAQARAARCGISLQLVQGDAHRLPYAAASFAGVVIESLLLFCDASRVLPESYRVLEPGGWLALNEMTLLGPAAPAMTTLMAQMGIGASREAAAWEELLIAAGFVDIETAVFPFRIGEQFRSRLRVDGLRRYLAATLRSLRQRTVRRAFFNRQMVHAARQFRSLIGYGLYVSRKPELIANTNFAKLNRLNFGK